MFFHKNIRLSERSYMGRQFYFVTLCCFERREIFSESSICYSLLELLCSESASRAFAIQAYCIMPDHVHFLAEGLLVSSDFENFVKAIKIKSSRAYSHTGKQPLWQKKYFDHILRSNEHIEPVAYYIWMNPVRKGLSRTVGEYPFAGSLTQMSTQMPVPSSLWCPPWKSKAPASEGGRYKTSP
jgi:putative transposase